MHVRNKRNTQRETQWKVQVDDAKGKKRQSPSGPPVIAAFGIFLLILHPAQVIVTRRLAGRVECRAACRPAMQASDCKLQSASSETGWTDTRILRRKEVGRDV
jgi:hypothetical protein